MLQSDSNAQQELGSLPAIEISRGELVSARHKVVASASRSSLDIAVILFHWRYECVRLMSSCLVREALR